MMRFFTFAVPCLLLLSFAACSDSEYEELDTEAFGYDYFPLELGRSYYYEVDSVVFREGVASVLRDSSTTLVREDVVDTLRDNTGQLLYRVERFERPNEQEEWRISSVLTMSRTPDRAFRTEDNLRFIKLPFPVKTGTRWDGNRFLPEEVQFEGSSKRVDIFKEWSYEVVSAGRPDTVNGRQYEEVATVQMADFESIIEIRRAVEKYARGIGLIYRELEILDTQCGFCCNGDIGGACQSLPWEEKGENGFVVRQRLVEYR